MRAALRVVDPSLNDVDLDKHVVWYRENAAVGQVKRVIAALCGAPYDSYPPDSLAVISRTFLTELKTAVLTARVVEALQQEIGEPATCELLSSLSIVA